MRYCFFRWLGVLGFTLAACGGSGGASTGDGGLANDDGGPPAVNPRPCLDPTPLYGESGYETCRSGAIHRPQKRVCPSTVPRPDPVPELPGARYFCRSDSDCAPMGPHAYCTEGSGLAGTVFTCQAGCVDDAECGAGAICVCNDVAGACYAADCVSDSDCTPGFMCASFMYECMGRWMQFGCQVPGDQCSGGEDCGPQQYCGRTPVGWADKKPRRCDPITCYE